MENLAVSEYPADIVPNVRVQGDAFGTEISPKQADAGYAKYPDVRSCAFGAMKPAVRSTHGLRDSSVARSTIRRASRTSIENIVYDGEAYFETWGFVFPRKKPLDKKNDLTIATSRATRTYVHNPEPDASCALRCKFHYSKYEYAKQKEYKQSLYLSDLYWNGPYTKSIKGFGLVYMHIKRETCEGSLNLQPPNGTLVITDSECVLGIETKIPFPYPVLVDRTTLELSGPFRGPFESVRVCASECCEREMRQLIVCKEEIRKLGSESKMFQHLPKVDFEAGCE